MKMQVKLLNAGPYSIYDYAYFKEDKDPNMKKIISKEDIIVQLMKSEENSILEPIQIKVKGPVSVRKFAGVVLRFYNKKLTKTDLKVFKHVKKHNPEYLDNVDAYTRSAAPSKLRYQNLVRASYVLEGYSNRGDVFSPVFGT